MCGVDESMSQPFSLPQLEHQIGPLTPELPSNTGETGDVVNLHGETRLKIATEKGHLVPQ